MAESAFSSSFTPLPSAPTRYGSSMLIVTRVPHKVRTAVAREDLVGWVQSGRKLLLGPNAPPPCEAGQVLLLPRGAQWDLTNEPAPQGFYIAQMLSFSRELVREAAALHQATPARLVRGAAMVPVDAELSEAMARAVRCLDSSDGSPALRRHRLLEVMLLLAERGQRFDTGHELRWDERLRLLIGQRPHEDWTMDTLASAFHTSASTLRRRVADSGCTLGELVREVRLETGLALLQSSELSVGDIAARCGYGSHSRFSAAFRQRFGLSPSDLRPEPAARTLNGPAQPLAQAG